MRGALERDLVFWEGGDMTLEELERRYPQANVRGVTSLHRRFEALAIEAVPAPDWPALAARLDVKPISLLQRIKTGLSRPLVVAVIASVMGTSVAAAAGVEPFRRGAESFWSGIAGIFSGHDHNAAMKENGPNESPADRSDDTKGPGGKSAEEAVTSTERKSGGATGAGVASGAHETGAGDASSSRGAPKSGKSDSGGAHEGSGEDETGVGGGDGVTDDSGDGDSDHSGPGGGGDGEEDHSGPGNGGGGDDVVDESNDGGDDGVEPPEDDNSGPSDDADEDDPSGPGSGSDRHSDLSGSDDELTETSRSRTDRTA